MHSTNILEVLSMNQLSMEEWRAAIKECRASGRQVRAWCREHNIGYKTFYYWERKLKDESFGQTPSVKTEWMSVIQAPDDGASDPSPQPGLTIRLEDFQIEVLPGFQPSLLAGAVKTLQSFC
jgi:putative transposase